MNAQKYMNDLIEAAKENARQDGVLSSDLFMWYNGAITAACLMEVSDENFKAQRVAFNELRSLLRGTA